MPYNQHNHGRIIGILNNIVAKHQALPHQPDGAPNGNMDALAKALDRELLTLERELSTIRAEMAARAQPDLADAQPDQAGIENVGEPKAALQAVAPGVLAVPMVYTGC